MIVRPSSTVPSVSQQANLQQNHRKPLIARALQWFWRFSQFYGEYTVRSPQEKQTWSNEQRAKEQRF
ncbi:MAG: hypothetical protein AAFR18_22900 [Cyanobacteria bacterium J06627_32]